MRRFSATSTQRPRTATRAAALPVVAALACFLTLAPEAKANASIFYDTGAVCTPSAPCWQAGMFGLLVGLGSSVGQSGYLTERSGANDNIRGVGDVGIGAGSFINTSPGNAAQNWGGAVDFSDNGAVTSHTFTVPNSTDNLTNVTLQGGTNVNYSNVTTALNQLLSISTYYQTASGEHQLGTGTGAFTGGTTIGTIGGGLQVFSVHSLNLTSVLTIRGNADDLIIINDPSTAIFRSAITLSGGITADQVLFNIYGTVGNILTINAASAIINADIIARSTWNVQAATVNGRLLGGYGTLLMGNNYEMNTPGDVPSFVPEPGEWALMAGGFGAIFYVGRRRKLLHWPAALVSTPGATVLLSLTSGWFRARMKSDAQRPAGNLPPPDPAEAGGGSGPGSPPSEAGIPPPCDSGGGGSAGVDLARVG